MLRYVTGRLLLLVPTLLGMSLLIFSLVRLLPGDVVDAMFTGDVGASAQAKMAVRRSLGLTDPVPVQYAKLIGVGLTGHLGKSFTSGEPIAVIMGRALPITAELALLAVLLATVVGIPLGVLSAVRPNTSSDLASRVCGLVGLSVPNFWFATLALLVSSLVFHWVPPVTWIPPSRNLAGNLSQVAIPVVAISVYLLAVIMRMT